MNPTDYSPAQVMAAISAALRAEDMQAAAGLVRVLAVIDPTSAEMIVAAVDALADDQAEQVQP